MGPGAGAPSLIVQSSVKKFHIVSFQRTLCETSLGHETLFCVVCLKPDNPVMVIRKIISPP